MGEAASDPAPSPRARRAALAAIVFVYLVYSSFGVAHPVLWGHYGHHAGEYLLRALASLRFHLVVPATSPGFAPPRPETIYLHHPIGYHHLYTLLIALFGNHHWIAAVAPALSGLLVMWALHSLVARHWGERAAIGAVAAWVALPFVWSFSILTDAMFPAMACSIVTTDSLLRYLQSPSKRPLRNAALATAIGALLFWEAYLQTALFTVVCLIWWKDKGRNARLGSLPAPLLWIVVTGAVALAGLALHASFVLRYTMVADLLKAYRLRSRDGLLPTLEQNGYWLLRLYGPVVETIGLAWLALFIVRARRGKARLRDLAITTFAAINIVYIALFPKATNVHLYRVFWFSTSFVLAAIDLACDFVAWLDKGERGRLSTRPMMTIVVSLCAALVLPQSIADLIESRAVMGSIGFQPYDADYPRQLFAREVALRTSPGDVIALHANIPHRVEFLYVLDRTIVDINRLDAVPALAASNRRMVVLTDGNPAPSERPVLAALMKDHAAIRFGRWLMIDLRAPGSGVREVSFRAERPTLLWWWFVSHVYPPMRPVERAASLR